MTTEVASLSLNDSVLVWVATAPATTAVFEQLGITPQGYKALEHESLLATCKVHQLEPEAVLAQLKAVTL